MVMTELAGKDENLPAFQEAKDISMTFQQEFYNSMLNRLQTATQQ
jgi:hypothetical protein